MRRTFSNLEWHRAENTDWNDWKPAERFIKQLFFPPNNGTLSLTWIKNVTRQFGEAACECWVLSSSSCRQTLWLTLWDFHCYSWLRFCRCVQAAAPSHCAAAKYNHSPISTGISSASITGPAQRERRQGRRCLYVSLHHWEAFPPVAVLGGSSALSSIWNTKVTRSHVYGCVIQLYNTLLS